MILSFYDRNFKGLQDNASLVIDSASYSLVQRGVELDELSCVCEPFTESIQPTFLVVKNDKGNYVYGALAGIPELTGENKTRITGTDLKTMFRSDVFFEWSGTYATVKDVFDRVFTQWKNGVNQNSFTCELVYKSYNGVGAANITLTNLKPEKAMNTYNAWDDIFAPYLKYYGLFMTSELDLVNKKVVFTVGRSMYRDLNVKLWEYGIYNYGKWVADINETQAVVVQNEAVIFREFPWILTSQNAVTTNAANRDIYPIKKKIIYKETNETDAAKITKLRNEANIEALERLTESMYKEDIELSGIMADFETRFNVWVRRGDEEAYKSLPCGELRYDASGLKSVQVGYRFTGLQFLL